MRKIIEKLQEERDTLEKRMSKLEKAIDIFRELCNHKNEDGSDAMVWKGNDSHKDYYECTICGKSRSV